MSEKVRTLNLTSGNVLATTTTTNTPTSTPTCGRIIGAPTLISSTFNSNAQRLTPTSVATLAASAAGGDISPNAATTGTTGTGGSAGSDTDSAVDFAQSAVIAQLNFHLIPDSLVASNSGSAGGSVNVLADNNSIMNSSQISTTSTDSMQLTNSPAAFAGSGGTAASSVIAANGSSAKPSSGNGKHLAAQSVAGKSCRFPKLEECAHFHYERVQLGPLSVRLIDDKSELLNSSIASQSIGGDIANNQTSQSGGPPSFRSFSPSNCWFIVKIFPHQCDPFLVKRSFDNMQMFDEMLHRCVYDRKISGLKNLQELDFKSEEDVEYAVAKYLERFSKIASDSLTCGTILTWLQLDNKGRRLPLADGDTMRSINTPAVGAAYGVRRYQAQASDEISIEVGDMISVIDMPSPAESIWWRGKKSHLQKSHYEVGFFPQACVATIGDKVPRNFPMPAPLVGQLDVSPTKPVLRKHGKLIAFFRSFILSRPSRRRLKQSGIYRERVFSCDLSEHLLNSGQEIPMVLKCCAEFIEDYGVIDGIYRLSGITSNIQKLRRAFDEERIPDLGNPEMKQDIHAVSSLLKMYFRELPNPLCTYQLYDNFVEAIQAKSESSERLRLMKETVLKLPPPHYRTLKYLAEHLNKVSQHSERTGMTDKNLAIVWAPNLLRSPALESGGVAALRGVGVQAVVTEYLIRNCHNIFDALDDSNVRLSYIATAGAAPATNCAEMRMDSLTDCESLLVEQREHDQSLTFVERPKSLSTGGPKLISLEEAQERHSRLDGFDMKQSMPITMVASNAANIGSYIEVGGGPSSLPDKYHTVLSVPRSWQKRKTTSWKSLFMRNQRAVGSGAAGGHDLKGSAATNGNDITTPRHHKEATQVTFAEADAIITSGSKAGKGLLKHDKPKSIELFETTREIGKPMEICVRSNSIDSLRTAGHSRSVSHDSYFDVLQSPQRGHMTTCPSRELSELGLNFDREEPEMRIFSESESLVSSPRVGKENVPPSSGATSRRIMRARPEEFSSQTNSVNPSPKKQPRLNLLLSPSTAAHAHANNNWSHSTGAAHQCQEHSHLSSDESCCKRYKLEDQLSDIQFIDCSTPEHTIANTQTLYTSVQVHAPPKSALSKSSLYSSTESTTKLHDASSNLTSAKQNAYEKIFAAQIAARHADSDSNIITGHINTRYSYPSVQLGAKRKEQDAATAGNTLKERFSYPISSLSQERRFYAKDLAATRMQVADEIFNKKDINAAYARNMVYNNNTPHGKPPKQHYAKPAANAVESLRSKNRNSYCGNNDQLNQLLLRSSSTELSKDAKAEMERSKISITPSSPIQSPRYSLLVGETSSENSSAVNTPQYDLDPLMVSSAMSCLSGISGNSLNQQHQLLLGVDASSYLGTSHESLGSNLTSHSNSNITTEKRDMHALKRELSLDLNPISTKMSVDHNDAGANTNTAMLHSNKQQHQQQHQQQLIPSPNNSNFTDNTSQSVTPSEFGYQHLQRQSSMHSLIETEENSPSYEEYENTPSNIISPLSTQKLLASPIKSTISITYNLRSPRHEESQKGLFPSMREKQRPKTLLETSFDENTVYEQVKLFRNSVTEVNQLLHEERKGSPLKDIEESANEYEKEMQDLSTSSVETPIKMMPRNKSFETNFKLETPTSAKMRKAKRAITNEELHNDDELVELLTNEDIQMSETAQSEPLDSLEVFEQEKLLYENVELRKPKSVYENILGEEMKEALIETVEQYEKSQLAADLQEKLELDSLDSLKGADKTQNSQQDDNSVGSTERKSPSNFSVKELATKFESSPVEQMAAFDFSFRSSMKKPNSSTGATVVATVGSIMPEIKASQRSLTNERTAKVSIGGAGSGTIAAASQLKQKLTKSQQITRSLDENAFVREFGAKHLHDFTAARSTQQLPELSEITSRRKSFDFTRPKMLNPPKRLPGMSITEEVCMRNSSEQSPTLKLEFAHKEKSYNHANNAVVVQQYDEAGDRSSIEHDYESAELKITPTTENRISLIQNNVHLPASDLSNSNLNLANSSIKVLSGVKLDRERIDKIKEERRQQLTQKYRTDSFKSKSKTDLNNTKDDVKFNAESLRIKSKSRGDMHTLQKDIDNLKEFGRAGSAGIHAGSESTLNTQATSYAHRVRSISDEKNQNCDTTTTTTTTTAVPTTTTTTVAAINVVNASAAVAAVAATQAGSSCSSSGNNTSDSSTASDDFPKKSHTPAAARHEEFSARATAQKFERKSLDFANGTSSGGGVVGISGNISSGISRERRSNDLTSATSGASNLLSASRSSLTSTREKISPQFSIRDVTAMFESRSQNQQ